MQRESPTFGPSSRICHFRDSLFAMCLAWVRFGHRTADNTLCPTGVVTLIGKVIVWLTGIVEEETCRCWWFFAVAAVDIGIYVCGCCIYPEDRRHRSLFLWTTVPVPIAWSGHLEITGGRQLSRVCVGLSGWGVWIGLHIAPINSSSTEGRNIKALDEHKVACKIVP